MHCDGAGFSPDDLDAQNNRFTSWCIAQARLWSRIVLGKFVSSHKNSSRVLIRVVSRLHLLLLLLFFHGLRLFTGGAVCHSVPFRVKPICQSTRFTMTDYRCQRLGLCDVISMLTRTHTCWCDSFNCVSSERRNLVHSALLLLYLVTKMHQRMNDVLSCQRAFVCTLLREKGKNNRTSGKPPLKTNRHMTLNTLNHHKCDKGEIEPI